MKRPIINKILCFVFGTLVLTSCARQISSDVYTGAKVGEASTTYAGHVKSVRSVRVQEGDQLQDNGLGIAAGGVTGGALGSTIGKGRGSILPTAIGAIGGAVAGSFIEKKLKDQTALEYIVELDNGGLMTVVQGPDHVYAVGQPVFVIVSQTGRSRIIPQI